jgi:Ca2+-binding RTX toxin-like protein
VLSPELAFPEVLLALGPFAPGATPELEGASEIEIEFEFRLRNSWADINGTRRADEFHWGPGPQHHPGLNLNPQDAGDQDVDVTVRGPGVCLIAHGAAGNDTIVPAPGPPFPNDGVASSGGRGDDRLNAPRNSWGSLGGGADDDTLTGGRQGDNLNGGDGNDRLKAAGGADSIRAGQGRDLIFGGPGRDRINSRDSIRDTVRCGAGRDRVKADRRDRLRGCEVVATASGLVRTAAHKLHPWRRRWRGFTVWKPERRPWTH